MMRFCIHNRVRSDNGFLCDNGESFLAGLPALTPERQPPSPVRLSPTLFAGPRTGEGKRAAGRLPFPCRCFRDGGRGRGLRAMCVYRNIPSNLSYSSTYRT